MGGLWIPAKFMALWNSPREVAPSPKYTMKRVSSPLILAAQAAPAAWGMYEPTMVMQGTMFRLRSPSSRGSRRPLSGSSARPKNCANSCSSVAPRASIVPGSREAMKIQSEGSMAMVEAVWEPSWPREGIQKSMRPERCSFQPRASMALTVSIVRYILSSVSRGKSGSGRSPASAPSASRTWRMPNSRARSRTGPTMGRGFPAKVAGAVSLELTNISCRWAEPAPHPRSIADGGPALLHLTQLEGSSLARTG